LTLRNFLRIIEQLFRTAEITDDQKKLNWITGYMDADIYDQWTSFEEYEAGSWNQFLERLKTEYSELTTEEQGSMDNLRKLCRENAGINLLEEKQLMSFKRRFVYIAQKCLRLPAVTKNRELVELFVKTLDSVFQDVLNSRLSIQGTLKVDICQARNSEERKWKIIDRNYTPFWSNVQRRREMYLAIRERRLRRQDKDVRVESDLLNDLGFNLCVALQSLVVRLVMYFGVEKVAKTEVPESRVKESE